MAKRFEVYKCEICGNVIEVLEGGAGELVCCEEAMTLMDEKTQEEGLTEKHIPVIEKTENGETIVKVGSVEHPMTEEHYIQFIEVFCDDKILRKYLEPNQKPEFLIKLNGDVKYAREYCNIHGLWKGENHVN